MEERDERKYVCVVVAVIAFRLDEELKERERREGVK